MEALYTVVILLSALTALISFLAFYYVSRNLRLLKRTKVWVLAWIGYIFAWMGYFSWFASFFMRDEKILILSGALFLAGSCMIGYGGTQIYQNLRKAGR